MTVPARKYEQCTSVMVSFKNKDVQAKSTLMLARPPKRDVVL
jgi:hypothetical protein